jgi:hypothetical protein
VTRDLPDNSVAAGNPARVIATLDPTLPSSRREHLFASGRPYQEFKDEYDQKRLAGNTLPGWLRSLLFPSRRD